MGLIDWVRSVHKIYHEGFALSQVVQNLVCLNGEQSRMADWVVRAGEAKSIDLFKGYGRHILVPTLFGFSVQYAPGLTPPASVDDLAKAGRFKNGQISYQFDHFLVAAVASLGYEVRLVRSPGGGFHHTFAVLYTANGVMLQKLPQDAADALSAAFLRRPNPYQVP